MAMLSMADSAASDITDMRQSMRELAIQAASDTNSAADRQYLQDEVDSLIQEIDRVATQTQYNGENLLDGSMSASFQVGAGSGQTVGFDLRSLKVRSFAAFSSPSVSNSGTQSSSGPTTDQTAPVLTGITIDKSVVDVSNGAQTINVQLSAADESLHSGHISFEHVETGHNISGNVYSSGVEGNALPSISLNIHENRQAGMYELSYVTFYDTAGNRSGLFTPSEIGETFPIEVVGGDIQPTIANQSYSWSQEVDTSMQSSGYTPTGAASQSYEWSLYNLGGLNIANSSSPVDAIASITAAIETVTAQRAEYGAMQNRLQYTISNLMSVSENTVAARSRIEDADFAIESAVLAKTQVLQQTGAAMLAQANARPQLVLQLIK